MLFDIVSRPVNRGVRPLRLCEGMKVMSKSILLVASLIFFLAAPFDLKARIAQSSERDLSRYDKIGPFNVPVMGTDINIVQAKVRDFIWEHWQQRRLGYAVVTFHSKEGEPSTSHMFIEPDEKGIWHLSVRIERKLLNRKLRKTINRTDSYKAYSIERIPGKDSSLRFKDKAGRVIVEW
jgi:hypothetical protein